MKSLPAYLLIAAFVSGGLAAPDPAEARGGGRDPTFIYKHARDEFVTRYPGDRWTPHGTYRSHGPNKGGYIERCHWIARDTFLGLPWGFQQRCVRYEAGPLEQ